MAKRTDIHSILVIGSGPIVIGQAAEFDYAGTQACLSLKEEGYKVILINSNPATIMTDTQIADKVYMEPLTLEYVSRILRKERPDALLATLGGQTGLNLAMQLDKKGILEECQCELLATSAQTIANAEDRLKFKELCESINQPTLESKLARTLDEVIEFACEIGYPVILRPAFTLGGTGGGFAHNENEVIELGKHALSLSLTHEVLVEKSILGFKEIEFEVIRDKNDTAIVVCSMENIDPVGVHTGDSMVVAPTQTLSKREYDLLSKAALDLIRALKIEGGCNVQFALDPFSFDYYVIEVNPRVSRSSALASKATAYPIARVSSKIAVGLTLDEILINQLPASLMPSVDYIVCKLPRFPFDKFNQADHQLTTQMKATGEVMSLGTNFEEALLKAIRGLEIGLVHLHHPRYESMSTEEICESIKVPTDDRLLKIAELFRRKVDLLQINQVTQIDNFFLDKILHIIALEQKLQEDPSLDNLKLAKKFGFSDQALQPYFSQDIRTLRKENKIVPVYKMIDGCAGEFNNPVNYYYSTYQRENESIVTNKESIVVIGSGPIRIGQGVEFDYSCVHAIWAIQEAGYEAIVINNNPETVSTDYSLSDKLYFEPLTLEDILNILDLEKPKGVIVTLGGQTPINLAKSLEEHHIPIIGTSPTSIEWAENRDSFEKIVSGCGIPQPSGKGVTSLEDGLKVANEIGYPCLVRPSYVLGGRAMQIVNNDTQLIQYLESAVKINENEPVLVDKYINGIEVEIDALCDTHEVFIPGLMQLIEATGIHSGDSISVYPPYNLSETVIETIKHYTTQLGLALQIKGLFNIQFIVDKEEKVYIIEVNPRSSRSVPFLSKVTGINLANLATKIMLGYKISELNIQESIPTMTYVKAPTFSFSKLSGLDAMLSPEMKSTGEAIGYDPSLNRALYKALQASHMKVVNYGTLFVTIADKDKQQALPLVKRFYDLGFNIEATKGTAQFLKDHQIKTKTKLKLSQGSNEIIESIRKGHITYIINTLSNSDNTSKDGYQIRRAAVENNITMFTSLDTLNVLLNVLEEMTIGVSPINGGQA